MESQVANEAVATLGDGALVLDKEETRSALEAYRNGEAWMRAGGTVRLSRHEAGILAERYGNEAAREMGLPEEAARRLVTIFESELYSAFERAHENLGGAPVEEEVEGAARRILESSRGFLDPRQQASLEEYLKHFGGPRDR